MASPMRRTSAGTAGGVVVDRVAEDDRVGQPVRDARCAPRPAAPGRGGRPSTRSAGTGRPGSRPVSMSVRAPQVGAVVDHPRQRVDDRASHRPARRPRPPGVRYGDHAASTQCASAFMPVSALTSGGSGEREARVVERGDRRDRRATGAALLAGGRVGHAEEAGELGPGVGGGDRHVGQGRAVGEAGSRRALLLLGEEAHRLGRVRARSATERDDPVDAVAPGLAHGGLHRARSERASCTSAKVDASARPRARTT